MRIISIPERECGNLSEEAVNFLHIDRATTSGTLRCNICHLPLSRNCMRDAYGNAVCSRHNVNRCCMCGRLILGPSTPVHVYGLACDECGTKRTMEELLQVRETVNTFYTRMHTFIPAYRLGLLPAVTMWEKYREYFRKPVFGAAWRDDGDPAYVYRIDIMSQQSHIGLARTLAHEVLHLWQYYRGVDAPANYAEGFCNLGAYLFLSTVDSGEALVALSNLMEDPDSQYGVAFRQLKVLYDAYGWKAVINAMRQYCRQPRRQ